jgi:hypothetical protein
MTHEYDSDLQRRLIAWLRAETLNGRSVDLVDIAVRYDLTLEQAEVLVATLLHLSSDDGRRLRRMAVNQ